MEHTASPCKIQLGTWDALGAQAARVRLAVFVQEQHVPPEMEMDALDAQCRHAVAYGPDGTPIGTGRLLPDGHIGRMAVLASWRSQGVGSRLLVALMQAARERGHGQVALAAQLQAQAFYGRHGFVPEGEVFLDAGIEHVLMRHHF